jgi:hypothetical protein
VTWIESGRQYLDLFGQRFSRVGTFLGTAFIVNPSRDFDSPSNPVTVFDGDGDFTIAWRNFENGHAILARRYDSAGVPLSDPLVVDVLGHRSLGIDLCSSEDGDFVVSWSNYYVDYDNYRYGESTRSIAARRLDSGGSPLRQPDVVGAREP